MSHVERLNEAARALRASIQPQPVCDHCCRGCRQNATDSALADWLDMIGRLHSEGDAGGPLVISGALAVADAILGGTR